MKVPEESLVRSCLLHELIEQLHIRHRQNYVSPAHRLDYHLEGAESRMVPLYLASDSVCMHAAWPI